MKAKRILLFVAFLAFGVALAGCAEPQEAEEDVGEGPVEPEPDEGPVEEEIAPEEEEDVGEGDAIQPESEVRV